MEFNKYFDHTILKADASQADVENVCIEAIKYNFKSVCVNSCNTKYVAGYVKESGIDVCIVVGFPLGTMSTDAKKFEAAYAIEDGATEIDMVINVGALKDEDYDYVKKDIAELVDVCAHNTTGEKVLLKVIIETCLLSKEEIVKACKLAVEAGADFVKTSTGFSTGGANVEDVKLMKETVGDKAGVKASGGIRDLATAKAMIEAGADRLGTSATVNIYLDSL